MNRASATQRHATAELRAGHTQQVTQHPQKLRVTIHIDGVNCAVDVYIVGHSNLLKRDERL
jgi:hypothetical protein